MGKVGRFVAGAGLIAAGFIVPGGFFAGKFGATLLGLSRFAGLQLINSAISRRPSTGREVGEARFQSSSTTQPERFVFGETELAISPVFWDLDPVDKSKLLIIGTICVGSRDGGGIEGVTRVLFNEIERISPVDPAETIIAQRLGLTAAGSTMGDYAAHLRYGLHLGADDQVADLETHLTYENWTEEHRGRGVAYIIVEMRSDTEEGKFVDGVPNIVVGVRGARCYDPRDDTWKWTKNSALIAREYLLHPQGYGLGEAELDDDLIIAAANICDSDPGNGRGAPMFECNGWFYQAASPEGRWENLSRILATCRGYLTYQNGQYGIRISQADASSGIQFTDEDIFGPIEVVLPGSRRKPNSATARYVNPVEDYQVAEVTVPDSFGLGNPYLTEDNDVPSGLEIDLPMVTDRRQAEDIAFITLKEARSALVRWVTSERGLQVAIGDIVELSSSDFGWTDQEIRIAGIETMADSSNNVRLTGLIHEAAAYDLDPNSTVPGVPDTDLPDPDFVDPPENVVLECNHGIYLPDGTFQPRLRVTWDASPAAFLERYEIAYRTADTGSGPGPWLERPSVPKGSDLEAFIDQVVVDGEYEVRVTAVNSISVHSEPVITASCIVGKPDQDPETIDGLDGRFTCIEGISLWWDPVVNPPPSGEAEFVWKTEIREQGEGATEEDRWAAGTPLDVADRGRWNWSFDDIFAYGGEDQNTYHLTLRRRTQFGQYASAPPIEITLENLSWPCTGVGDPGTGQCPNIAPADAAIPHRSPQGTGTVAGYVYSLVNIERTGVSPGEQVSYCYDGRVGPGGEGVYELVSCDGKFGRRSSGLRARVNSAQAGQFGHGIGAVRAVNKDGIFALECNQQTQGYAYAALTDPRLGYDANGDPDPAAAHDQHFLVAKYQWEGTSSPLIGGNSRTLTQNLTGSRWKRIAPIEYFMTSPFMGVVRDPTAGASSDGYLYFNSRLEGFSAGINRNYLVRLDNPFDVVSIGHRTSNNERVGAVHFGIGPGARQWASHKGSPLLFDQEPMVAKDATYSGPWFPVVGIWHNGNEGNQLSGPNTGRDIGRGWWWSISDYRRPYVEILGVGSVGFAGVHYAAVSNAGAAGTRGHSPTARGARDQVWANFKDEFWAAGQELYVGDPDVTIKGGFSFPEWKTDPPWTRWEIWDGPSWEAGSSIIDSCDVPEGIDPGDVWEYDSEGNLGEGGEVENAEGLLILDFLDDEGNVLGTVEPDPTSNAAYERITASGVVPVRTQFFRFRQEKRGSADAWFETNRLQFNYDPFSAGCCSFSDPLSFVSPPVSGDPLDSTSGGSSSGGSQIHEGDLIVDSASGTTDPHVGRVWSPEHGRYVTSDEMVDAIDEHRQGAVNLLHDGRDPRTVAAAAGDQTGEPYPILDLDRLGIAEGAPISLRIEAKVEE